MDLPTLSAQRWFAGKGRPVAQLSRVVEVGGLEVVDVHYADDVGPERYLIHGDDLRWAELVRALRTTPLTSATGRLELHAGPGLQAMLDGIGEDERPASLDQSNTLVVVGGRLLVKAYRSLRSGVHPEVETFAVLAGTDAPVPGFGGSLLLIEAGGLQTTLALLQQYVPDAASGWEAVIAPVVAHLRGEAGAPVPAFDETGAAAARLHRVLAERLGTERGHSAGASWHREAVNALDLAHAMEPAVDSALTARLARRLASLKRVHEPLVQRIHGDLNLAQFLFTPSEVLVVDFEGNPTVSLARRRLPDTPLRDLATLLRSIDHVGSAAARRAAGVDPTAWIEHTRAGVLESYEREHEAPTDHAVLHALEIVAECRELVYAHRVVPEWAYVARAGLARLMNSPLAS